MATQKDVRRIALRLPTETAAELKPLIQDGWRCQAPKDLVKRSAKRP